MDWNWFDYAFAGTLVLGTAVTYTLAVRKTDATAYRTAAGVALASAFILVWLNAAVGIIGSAANEANLMYGGVLAVGVIGAIVARFRARGMAGAMVATALAQAVVTLVAVIAGLGSPASGPLELLTLNGFFIALWLVSARLFQNAAEGRSAAAEAPGMEAP